MNTEKKRLTDEAARLGIELKPSWPARRIKEEIERHRATQPGTNLQQSSRTRLEMRATSLGMLVHPDWDDDVLADAVRAHEAAESAPFVPPAQHPPEPPRRFVGPPQRGPGGGWSPRG